MEELGTYLDIYQLYKQVDKNPRDLFEAIKLRLALNLTERDFETLQSFVKTISSKFNTKWSDSHRIESKFFSKHCDWLSSKVEWPFGESATSLLKENEPEAQASSSACITSALTPTKVSRKPFDELSVKQKKRRVDQLSEYTQSELAFALVTKLKSEGNVDLAKILSQLVDHPEDIHKTREFLFGPTTKTSEIPSDNALALMTSLGLSKWQYSVLRKSGIDQKVNYLPSYHKILEAKKDCYPSDDDVIVNESVAQIRLQSILDLTTKRIMKVCHVPENINNLVLVSKWGFDGASGQSMYNQGFAETQGDEVLSDSSVFMTSLVPLKLVKDDEIVWENERPSSTHYCRPVKFQFVHESTILTKMELERMEGEINTLVPTLHDGKIVKHDLIMTMIDGKISSVVTSTPTSTCNICEAKPSEMNDLDKLSKREVKKDYYKYGLSTLHLWIRCLECLLHISYNIDFKKWSARQDEHKELRKVRKNQIVADFRSKMGILVDVVKQGVGTTNNGNTARTFFKNYSLSAAITGLDENLVLRIAVLLQAISSGKRVNIDQFKQYANKTAQLYVSLYEWYYMPASIHKLLIHGAEIIQHFSHTPIGKLSEEASEARNKDFRNVREHHSRKTGRIQTNTDILHNFLVSSDPVISHIRPRYTKPARLEMFPEPITLLILDEEETCSVNIDTNIEMEIDPLA